MVYVIVKFVVKEESADNFNTIMNSLKLDLPGVDGCEAVQIYNSLGDPAVYSLVETWQSEDFHKRHIDHLQSSGDWNKISALLEKDPEVFYAKHL